MSILNPNGDGPSKSTLRRLKTDMQGFIQTHHEKTQNADAMATLPRKCCKICCKTFDLAYIPRDSPMEAALCEHCEKQLMDGWAAFVSDNRYAFLRFPDGHDFNKFHGQHVMVPKDIMDGIEAKYGEQVKTRDPEDERQK